LRAGQECTCQEQAGSSSHPVPPLSFSEYTPWHRCAVIFKLVRYFLTGTPARSQVDPVGGERQPGPVGGFDHGPAPVVGRPDTHRHGYDATPALPKGFRTAQHARLPRRRNYRGRAARGRLYRDLAGNRYGLVGIICSGEIVMAKWKWVLALRAPAKLFIINENGDYFWFDRHPTWARSADLCSFARSGGVGRGTHAGGA